MNSSPKLSIIIPVYKVEEYIRECLDSIRNQTFTDFEALLIDDGSPDGSGAICDEYAAKDSRFKVWHKENGGVSSARNLGLDNAKGEWVTFIDPDDYLMSNDAYREIFEESKGKEYDLISFGYKRGDREVLPSDSIGNKKNLNKEDILSCAEHFFVVWSSWFKRNKIGNHKFENIKSSEDVLFIQTFLLQPNVRSLFIINKAYIYYRENPTSFINTFQPTLLQDKVYVVSRLREYIKSNNIEIKKLYLKDFEFFQFFEALETFSKYKGTDYLAEVMKEYVPKLGIDKNIMWNDVFIDKKPYITYLLIKLKLYKLAAKYIKRKWGNKII